jgi:NAD(P)-dependent dehydrogenase (short-subunit alcohol dehydrogenase family)
MPPINGQSLLVIGGSSGIGAAVAKLSAAQGVDVAIASSNPTRVADAVRKIEKSVPNASILGYMCDLNSDDVEAHLEKLLMEVTTAMGRQLDHIVHTANVFNPKPISEVTIHYLHNNDQFRFIAPLLLAKLAPRFLNQTYQSSLTFTNGQIAEKPIKGYAVSAAWATALFGITRSLALDLTPIRVNVVSPGPTDTEMWGNDEQRRQAREMYAKIALLGKPGSAEEVAEAYIYLMKDTNNTGSCVSTSGGVLIQ